MAARSAVVDARTPLHFGVGVAAGAAGIDAGLAMIVVLSYEAAVEAYRLRNAHTALFAPGGAEGRANSIVDISMTLMGVYVGTYLRRQYQTRRAARAVAELERAEGQPPPVSGLGFATWPARQLWRQ